MRTSSKFVLFFAVTYAVFLLLAFGIVEHVVPPLGLGIAAIVYTVATLLILRRLLREGKYDTSACPTNDLATGTADVRNRERVIRIAKIGIVIFVLAFVNALRYVGAAPLWMVVGGATVNLAIIIGLVLLINKQIRSLRPQGRSF